MKFSPSPALIPARASVPPSPSSPPERSPVVHCILPSAYRNTTNDSTPLVASIHWKVLVYSKIIKMYACKMNELRHMSLGKHLFSSIKKHPIKCSSPPMVNLKVTVFVPDVYKLYTTVVAYLLLSASLYTACRVDCIVKIGGQRVVFKRKVECVEVN